MNDIANWVEFLLWAGVFGGVPLFMGLVFFPALLWLNERPGQEITREWYADSHQYQQGEDGRVRRRYANWGELDWWSRWKQPEEFARPMFSGFPCES